MQEGVRAFLHSAHVFGGGDEERRRPTISGHLP